MTNTTTTAAALLAVLERTGCFPRVTGEGLTFYHRPPAEGIPLVRVLHTGIRAILTRRPWLGCSTDTGWATELDSAKLLPRWVGLLAVQGDKTWHRIKPNDRLGFLELFSDQPEPIGWAGRDAWVRRIEKARDSSGLHPVA